MACRFYVDCNLSNEEEMAELKENCRYIVIIKFDYSFAAQEHNLSMYEDLNSDAYLGHYAIVHRSRHSVFGFSDEDSAVLFRLKYDG